MALADVLAGATFGFLFLYLVVRRIQGLRFHGAVLLLFGALGGLVIAPTLPVPQVEAVLFAFALALPLLTALTTMALRIIPRGIHIVVAVAYAAVLAVSLVDVDGATHRAAFVTYIVTGYGLALFVFFEGLVVRRHLPRYRYAAALVASLATAMAFLAGSPAAWNLGPMDAAFVGPSLVVAGLALVVGFAPPPSVHRLARAAALQTYMENSSDASVLQRVEAAAAMLGEGDVHTCTVRTDRLHLPDGRAIRIERGPLLDCLRDGHVRLVQRSRLAASERAIGRGFGRFDHLILMPIGDARSEMILVVAPVRALFPEATAASLQIVADQAAAELRSEDAVEEHRRSAEALAELDDFKSRFMRNVGHEIANPLSPIQIQLSLLRNDKAFPLQGKQLDRLDVIERNVRRIDGLVRDLSDVARMQQAQLQLEIRRIDLRGAMESAISAYAESAKQAGCELLLDAPKALECHADGRRVGQVLDNLISNAIKYSPDGGKIVVRAHIEERDAVIEVEDEGLGMDETQLEELFQPYSRVHKGRGIPGTGLGLHLVRGLIEAHGGTIECTSAGPGKGSRFTVHLPLDPRQA